ncbi:unnamed protein product [marine sediment metagenome]|uniref:Uncharacterized protein n=1 Tax=marine sediment metagenome TaxID=412755 RepID=X1GWS4_9ZZZZ
MLGIETPGSHARLKLDSDHWPTQWQLFLAYIGLILSGIGFLLCLAILFG